MSNNLNYMSFFGEFAENILLNLNSDYRNYISFTKKNSKLKKIIDRYRFDDKINHIAYNLVEKGRQKVFIYEIKKKIIISLSYHIEEKLLGKFTLYLPFEIMNPIKRINIMNKLKRMDYPKVEKYNSDEFARNSTYLIELVNLDFEKLTKNYLSTKSSENFTDQYILFREIRKRIKQTMLVNYIFNTINKNIHKSLDIIEEDDNIVFNSKSIEDLKKIEIDLVENRKPVKVICSELYKYNKTRTD